jgi:glutamate-1-semialdehyde 2,1-aminomutase
VHDYATAKTSDTALFARFFHELLERGIYFPPAQYESAFVSLAHTEGDIDATVRAAGEIFRELRA